MKIRYMQNFLVIKDLKQEQEECRFYTKEQGSKPFLNIEFSKSSDIFETQC